MRLRIVLSVFLICVGIVGAIAGSYALSLSAISRSSHNWCTSLKILTYKSVPKPGNPVKNVARAEEYALYEALLQLERDYHC